MSVNGSLTDVTLRPWPASKKEELSAEDLLLQIEQLSTERKHLRNVTEKSLQEDIAAGTEVSEDIAEGSEQKIEDKDAPSKEERLQEVFRAQIEMSSHMDWIKFAANNAVDLLSLVLSADPNKRALNSFSGRFATEALNQGVPFGSFGLSKEDHTHHVRKPDELLSLEEFELRQDLVSKGSRMVALDSATDEILKAAKKLEREVRRETKYWQEIMSISDKGWPIQRLRQNTRNVPFAVRYGHSEASNHFKARGLAPLRMDKDGSIMLDPALALKPKTLRVRISENGKITGTSHLPVEGKGDSTAIEKTIQLARDSLFEEELYQEMTLETRQLLAYGAEYRDSVIHVTLSEANDEHGVKKLLLDCIPREGRVTASQEHTNDTLAQSIAEGLRLLLVHEHSMRLHRRTQLPPPLTGQKRDKPPPPLLRTLLAVFRHLEGVNSLYDYLESTAKTLGRAGLGVQLETTREVSWAKLAESLQSAPRKGLSATDQLLDIFSKPFDGRATLSLPSPDGTQPEVLTISTRTLIGQPTFGTEHKLALPALLATELGLFPQLKFTTVPETTSYLDWILSLHVAHRQLKSDFSDRVVVKGNDARITIGNRDAKKGSVAQQDIQVELQNGELRLIVQATGAAEGAHIVGQSYTWKGQEEDMSMREKVASWVG